MQKEEEEEEFVGKLKLSAFQIDALRELSHIGACHATTSLSEMLGGAPIDVKVPIMEVISVKDAKGMIMAEKIVAGTFVRLEGDYFGYLQVLFPEKSALALVDLLMGRTIGETKSLFPEMEKSAIMETGNILTCSFCNAIAEFLGITVLPSPPAFAYDMAGSLVDAAVISVISIAPIMDYVIIFKSTFFEKSDEIYGYIMIYPCHVKLKKILSMLEEKVKVNE